MKQISFLLLVVLLSFCYSKSDAFLQRLYDDIKKDQVQIPTDYYKYIKNVKTKIDTITRITDVSKLSSLEKVGVPKHIAMSLELAEFTVDKYHSFKDYGFTFNPTTNKTSVVLEVGAVTIKEDKARFAYFKVTVDATMIRQKEKKIVEHCKKHHKHCWNEIVYEERKYFTQEDSEKIQKSMFGKAYSDLLLRIKTLMDINADGDNFLADTSNFKFLA